MSSDPFEAVPATKRQVARDAVSAVVGTGRVAAIAAVSGGASGASTFRVDAGGRHFFLRLEGPASPLRNPHQYASARIAAEAGIAPTVYHADEAARVAVTDFIEAQPLKAYPGGPNALARALGELVRRVQTTAPFAEFVRYPDIVARLWTHVCRTNLFTPGVLDPVTQHLARIRSCYVWDPAAIVSSHNDLIPSNVLFDGQRLWLIDWESAYRNDPLVDVATGLDNFAPSPDLEDVMLRAWHGRAIDETLRTRLVLVRALTRLYYAGVLLSASAAANPDTAPDGDLQAPSPLELKLAIQDGRLKPGTTETKHILGKMFVAAFLSGGEAPGLEAAVTLP